MSDLTKSRAIYKRKMALKKAKKQLAVENKAKMTDDASALRKITKPTKQTRMDGIPETCKFCNSDEHLMGHYDTTNRFIITCEKALEKSNNKAKQEQYQLELNKKWVNQVSGDNATNEFNFITPVFDNNVIRPVEKKTFIKISKNVFDLGD